MDGYTTAVLAYAYVHTEGTGFAIHDVVSDFSLAGEILCVDSNDE